MEMHVGIKRQILDWEDFLECSKVVGNFQYASRRAMTSCYRPNQYRFSKFIKINVLVYIKLC